MAKLHKIEFYLVDWNESLKEEDIFERMEREFEDDGGIMQSKYAVKNLKEWSDDHKFNLVSTPLEEYEKEFE